MDSLYAFLLAAAVTLFFVRNYLRKLTAARSAPASASKHPAEQVQCPRCARQFVKGAAFCPHCGAPLAMWNIHRAQVSASGEAPAQGKLQPLINASLCVGCGSCVHECPETGTLELVNGKAILAHPERCTGHARCAEVCPTQAIALSLGGKLQTIKVPMVSENFETNVPGLYIVGELGGMGLIKTAINEGKLVIDYVRNRLDGSARENGHGEVFDIAIIGAGPAGLSASLSAHQYGLRYLTVEQGEIAATIRNYPRQKFLMAEPIDIPLYGPLYVADGTKEALLSVWETIIANTGVRIQTNERLEQVQKADAYFRLQTTKSAYTARYVVFALGRRGSPRKLGVPGEDLSKVSYRLIEADDYQQKNILVVGGGDSAIEAALALTRSGSNKVILCHRSNSFRRARERNQQQLENAERSGRFQVWRDSQVLEIRDASVLVQSQAGVREISNDFVFVMAGGETPEEFLRRTGIEIVEKAVSLAQPTFA